MRQIKDILHPKNHIDPSLKMLLTPELKELPRPAQKNNSLKIAKWTILTMLITMGLFYGFKIIGLGNSTKISEQLFIEKIKEGASALQNFNTSKATSAFSLASSALTDIKNTTEKNTIATMLNIGENLVPDLKQIPKALNDLITFTGHMLSLSQNLDTLQSQAFHMAFNGEGPKIINSLRALDTDITAISALSANLSAYAQNFKIPLPENYLALNIKLKKTENLLKGFTNYLSSPEAKHLAILLQNPSEIRPSGGFIGSFIALDIQDGSITSIDVKDIYDVDGQLEARILPPQPLQTITARWGARDANWFFDFPTSAAKVLYFLNQSKIYSERNIKFQTAVAINVPVLEDILEIIGPIELPNYKLTITKDNFLESIQTEVESGLDNKNGHPKKILNTLTPLILNKLANLNNQDKLNLAKKIRDRMLHKDISLYFEDRALETYAQNEGMGGEIYGSNSQNSDDYLALVNANISGGKTDAFINEKISLDSLINSDGKIYNTLNVEREHLGNKHAEKWYRAPNKIFLQILSPENSKLLNLKGQDAKIPDPQTARSNYKHDSDITTIENSTEWLNKFKIQKISQFGKNTFAFYWTIKAGAKKILSAQYEINQHFIVSDKANYRFVYEKQSGIPASFNYSVEAPPGFIWQESQNAKFTFATNNPEARIILDLTLEKI